MISPTNSSVVFLTNHSYLYDSQHGIVNNLLRFSLSLTCDFNKLFITTETLIHLEIP